MNRNIKKTVYKIQQQDKLAREDDWYLIQQTLIQMLPCNPGAKNRKGGKSKKRRGRKLLYRIQQKIFR